MRMSPLSSGELSAVPNSNISPRLNILPHKKRKIVSLKRVHVEDQLKTEVSTSQLDEYKESKLKNHE
jgi:hypothetical protein